MAAPTDARCFSSISEELGALAMPAPFTGDRDLAAKRGDADSGWGAKYMARGRRHDSRMDS